MTKRSPNPSDKAFLSSILSELRQPFKTKSVRDAEAKQGKDDLSAASQSGACARALTKNFELRDLVYNRVTKEDGAIRRVYKMNGVAMCEVAVPKLGDSWLAGYYVSDWAEDVLQISDNESLNSSKFEGVLNLEVGRVFSSVITTLAVPRAQSPEPRAKSQEPRAKVSPRLG
jgi:hypothetical protein